MTAAVITGASRGIGREVALSMARRGLDVALLARSEGELTSVAAEVTALGRRSLVLPCDVSTEADVTRAAERALRTFGAPRVVVNNAGIVRRSLVHQTETADWDAVLAVNLRGSFLLTRALLPSMLAANAGTLVMISSISGTLGTRAQAAYCASKWGLVGFMKSLAEELTGTGVRTVAIAPGSVDTKMLEGSGFAPRMTAKDVAELVTYAALDAPAATNGSTFEMFG